QTESTMDANSLSIDPGFTSDTDLHIASETLDGAGTPIAEVDVDIDYQNRHPLHPDIGADEFRTGLNSPPILVQAINDTILTQDISVNLIISDMNTVFDDPDTNDVLTFSAISSNVHVNAIIDSNSLFINYTVGYHGSAQIVVKATDLGNLSVTDTFIVTIIGVNDPPNAVDDHVQANTYIKDIIYVLNNDSDANDDPIQIIKVDQPEHGIVETKFENTEITYISYHYFTGIDSFRYHIEDQYGGSDSAMVYVEVIPLFEMVETGIVNVSHGSVAWGDFDNDDDLDIAISGWLGTINEYTSKIYRNDDTIFTDIEANLVNVSSSSPGCLDWGDADNDGDLDLLLCGLYQATPDVRYASRMYNNGQYGFLDFGYNDLEDVSSGSISWGDHNNDGLLDFLLSGSPTEGDDITNVYQHYDNLPGGTDFLNISAGIQSIWSGRSTWVDFDNDNDLDVFVCGFGAEPSKLYENTDGEYELMNSAIPGFGNADAAWGDYDNDGDMDLLICGKYLDNPTTKIYRNDGPAPSVGWIFTDIEADLQDVESGSVVWGDVDNNGDLDIVITGNSGGFGLKTELYLNHNGEFEHYDLDLQDVGRSAVAFGDYDNDNDLDLFITGVNNNQLTRFYKNNRVLTNQKPGTPTGLTAEVAGNSVVFKWNPAIDDSTSSKSLTYNIQVRSDEGTLLTVPGMSGENGYRKIPEYGNAGQDTSWILTDLDPGETYYWKVQAIDNSFIGSPFAKEQSFVITAIENINDLPKTFALYQNYPNPFNPSTKIKFDVPVASDIKIILYNILGEKVRTLVNIKYAPGRHEYVLEASGLAAGLYFYRIKTDQYMKTKRMILLK
ncbi:MAG: FG-GAP-like repeat-containing protein, partial [Calditrichaceae bacterium]